MKRILMIAILVLLAFSSPKYVIPQLESWCAAALARPAREDRPATSRTWIVRESFPRGPVTMPEVRERRVAAARPAPPQKNPWQLPADLQQRLLANGAQRLVVAPLAGTPDVVCGCQVEVSGTAYLRRFECRGRSVELAGQRLLLEVQTWLAARSHLSRAYP